MIIICQGSTICVAPPTDILMFIFNAPSSFLPRHMVPLPLMHTIPHDLMNLLSTHLVLGLLVSFGSQKSIDQIDMAVRTCLEKGSDPAL